jgi:hypothetical protein
MWLLLIYVDFAEVASILFPSFLNFILSSLE